MMEDDHSSDFIIKKMSEALKYTSETGIVIGEMWKSVAEHIFEQNDE